MILRFYPKFESAGGRDLVFYIVSVRMPGMKPERLVRVADWVEGGPCPVIIAGIECPGTLKLENVDGHQNLVCSDNPTFHYRVVLCRKVVSSSRVAAKPSVVKI